MLPPEAYQWATGRCARSEQCRSDIADKLRQRGLPKEELEPLLDRLEDEGYINEERYCRAFVSDKYRFDRWGRLKIAAALRQRRIAESLIGAALEEVIDEEVYLLNLRDLIAKKAASLCPDRGPSAPEKDKIVRFVASRGYEPHLIFSIVED